MKTEYDDEDIVNKTHKKKKKKKLLKLAIVVCCCVYILPCNYDIQQRELKLLDPSSM